MKAATADTIRVGWIGQQLPWQPESKQLALLPTSGDDVRDLPPDIQALVVEATNAVSVEFCRDICEHSLVPVLLIVEPQRANEFSDWVSQRDDLVAPDAEWIEYRLHRLLAISTEQHDPLTKALTRRSIFAAAGRELATANPDSPVSLLSINLDHFKNVNDKHGHSVGDKILVQVAAVLSRLCESRAICGRTGGEEFSVLVRTSASNAVDFGNQIRQAIQASDFPDGVELTVSVGCVTADCSTTAELLCGHSCEALYAAKAAGRNCVISYEELEQEAFRSGDDLSVTGLETRTRVLTDRVANFISLRSRRLLDLARREAETDGLTEFYTRRYLDRRLATEFKSPMNSTLTVALVDLDHFGKVNKEHGWPTGDKVLQESCRIISNQIRQRDWVGRYGGEEFCIVMPDTAVDEAQHVLERLRQAIESHDFRSTTGAPLQLSASIGIVSQQTSDSGPAELLERASCQTLRAKDAGRNMICFAQA